jgi:hypothetical protein
MKREILFVMLCIGLLSISKILYAGFIQTTDTSTLSDREMKLITGTCTSCYEWDWETCRWWGDAECAGGDTCPSSWYKFTDDWVPQVTLNIPPYNGKTWYFSGSVECYQPYTVESDGTLEDAVCYTGNPIPPSEQGKWASWFYSCKSGPIYIGLECTKCKWGNENGSQEFKNGYKCN